MLRNLNLSSNGKRDSSDGRVGVLASEIPTGGNFPAWLLNDIDAAYPGRLYSLEVLTLPSAGKLYLDKRSVGSFTGAPNGTYSGTQRVEKFDQGAGRVSTADGAYSLAVSNVVTPPAPVVTGVSVIPATATGAVDFDATVLGDNGPDQAVSWTRNPAAGSVDANGAYLPPAPTNEVQVIKVRATSVADPSKYGEATVTIAALVVEPEPEEPPYGTGLLNSYEELQAAIKCWLHRSDLATKIPLFILLAEAKINRIAQVQAMEKEAVLLLQPGAQLIALPASFITPITAWIDGTDPGQELGQRTPESLPITAARGTPAYWAIDGTRLKVDCPVATQRRITLRYRGGFALTDLSPSNSLLLKYPDLYLYGALLESAPYIRDFESRALWQENYNQAVREVNRTESRARAGVPLRTELSALLN